MPLKSYALSAAATVGPLHDVIALLKTEESFGSCAKYSNTGMPVTFSTAGCPVFTECSVSA